MSPLLGGLDILPVIVRVIKSGEDVLVFEYTVKAGADTSVDECLCWSLEDRSPKKPA